MKGCTRSPVSLPASQQPWCPGAGLQPLKSRAVQHRILKEETLVEQSVTSQIMGIYKGNIMYLTFCEKPGLFGIPTVNQVVKHL